MSKPAEPAASPGASLVPVVDLAPWFTGGPDGRRRVAAAVDSALRAVGFLLIVNHGVSQQVRDDVRVAARRFFDLQPEVKERYRARVGDTSWQARGWTPPGAEANANSDEGVISPPDLKESFSNSSDEPTGDPSVDAEWFTDNVWPTEVPEYRGVATEYVASMRGLADELLGIAAIALDLPESFFLNQASHPTWEFFVHWYPALRRLGPPEPGQLRIGSHTDFGTFTILDREPGTGGLQVMLKDGSWVDAPWVPGAFTVNIGDMLARWTGDRWLSNRHRVLAPDESAPEEDLLSLVYFHEADPTAELRSVPPPIGLVEHEPVQAGDYLRSKLAAIAIV